MKNIIMFSTSEIFGVRKTGGLKRFLELYKYYEKSNDYNVEFYSGDDDLVLRKNKILNYTSLKRKTNNKFYVPNELLIFFQNFKHINNLKKKKYDDLIVFDVPTALSLSLLNCKDINLFIRQDLIGYKSISLKEKTNNTLIKKVYLNMLKVAEAICLIQSKKVIVQCEYDLNKLLERHKLLKRIIAKKSFVQINNINPTWIEQKNKKNIEQKSFSFKNIGFIGDFSNQRKGHKLFLKAIERINSDDSNELNCNVIVIGDGDSFDFYKTKYENQNVSFIGRVENVKEYLTNFDLLVVPSYADSCPNTILEAIYNDVAVIGSKAGGIPEILNYEEALFELSVEDLVSNIETISKEENYYLLLQKQLNRKEELMFNWSDKIARIVENENIN
ncbi:glycosyltransferase family 4 protein [Exiguobacterium oxidotolerans]|uniref:glycosyltransferase family 4 protein n=1 Tax=Exiguobacterium oxidotolerans TaxID=223958 RepID=UPI000494212D|nr:glycosyltransferase family 4 protein [Exiguobacterium oxidotolerans]